MNSYKKIESFSSKPIVDKRTEAIFTNSIHLEREYLSKREIYIFSTAFERRKESGYKKSIFLCLYEVDCKSAQNIIDYAVDITASKQFSADRIRRIVLGMFTVEEVDKLQFEGISNDKLKRTITKFMKNDYRNLGLFGRPPQRGAKSSRNQNSHRYRIPKSFCAY